MKRSDYDRIEAFMQCCMEDTAHDREHVYRVLALALEIAQTEPEADCDILSRPAFCTTSDGRSSF